MAWHATGRLAWPPTHLDKWGVCVRSMVSIWEHLWPLGCGDRGQWWPWGSRRALAHATKARHRLGSQPCTHSHMRHEHVHSIKKKEIKKSTLLKTKAWCTLNEALYVKNSEAWNCFRTMHLPEITFRWQFLCQICHVSGGVVCNS